MKYVYPIILTPEKEGGFSVLVPDLEIGTQGETVAECIDMARDAIVYGESLSRTLAVPFLKLLPFLLIIPQMKL